MIGNAEWRVGPMCSRVRQVKDGIYIARYTEVSSSPATADNRQQAEALIGRVDAQSYQKTRVPWEKRKLCSARSSP